MALCSLGSRISGSEVLFLFSVTVGFPGGSVVKNPPANAGDAGLGRSPERKGQPNPEFLLGVPMDRGA